MDNNNINTEDYYYAPQSIDEKKGIAIAVLVLGIVSTAITVACCWCYGIGGYIGIVCAIVALIMYLVNKNNFGPNVASQAKAGFICSIVTIVIFVAALAIFILTYAGIFSIGILSSLGSFN